MPQPLRSNLARRRSRLAQAMTVAGSLALGTLVLHRLVDVFREDFFLYYGISDSQYVELRTAADAALPMTVGQLSVVVIALALVAWFIHGERRRLHQEFHIAEACRCASHKVVEARLSKAELFDAFVTRTSLSAGALWLLWMLQTSAERWFSGAGWGLEYADWRSLLPLASVFGIAVLAGMLAAVVSMVGLRAIEVLELVRAALVQRLRRPARALPRLAPYAHDVRRTLRELIGCDILSRPPPVLA